MKMFQRLNQILSLFDQGMLSERGLATVLEHEARGARRLPASRGAVAGSARGRIRAVASAARRRPEIPVTPA